MIVASFAKQYGIRLLSESMTWGEFSALCSGLMADTPLGQIVSIRSEEDSNKIKSFSADEKRIRNEWRNTHKKVLNKEEYDQAMQDIKAMFVGIAKGGARHE